MKVYIYKITNILNGKCYVGSTAYPVQRNRHHLFMLRAGMRENQKLHDDFKRYGESVFHFEIIDTCPAESRDQKEMEYIATLRSVENGYNIKKNAATRFGFVVSQETKAKLRARNTGLTATQETRRKLSMVHMGKRHSAETRMKMSSSRKGHPVSEETRRKLSEAKKGWHHSPETIQKMREASTGRHQSIESRQKRSISMKAYLQKRAEKAGVA
jgi:group I intron endonuclease